MCHVVNNEGIILKQLQSTNDRQIWKEFPDAFESLDAVEQQKVCDFCELGESEMFEVIFVDVFKQNYLQITGDDITVPEFLEGSHVGPDVEAIAGLRFRFGQEQYRDRKAGY